MSADQSEKSRRTLVAANWKMNLLQAEAAVWCRSLRNDLADSSGQAAQVVVFPSFPLIPVVARELAGSHPGDIAVGGQDLHPNDKGAHTGDVSGAQLADAAAHGRSAGTASGGATTARATSWWARRPRPPSGTA